MEKGIVPAEGIGVMVPVADRPKRIKVNGAWLPYVEQGDGPPVVFVHGSVVDLRVWKDVWAALGTGRRLIAMSQRYFGSEPWPDDGSGFSMQVHADDLCCFIEKLGLGPVTLAGWSTGAGACLAAAVQRPELIASMFLYEPALASYISDSAWANEALQDRNAMTANAKPHASAGEMDAAVAAFMDGVNDQIGTFGHLPLHVQNVMLENGRMLPLLFAGTPPPAVSADDMRGLNMPVTVALGTDSRAFYQVTAKGAAALIPSNRMIEVKGGRHLFPVEDPSAFAGLVLDFLAGAGS